MRILGKFLASAAVLAFVSGVSVGGAQAVPAGKVAASSQVELIAAKKKAAPKKKAAKKSAKKAAKKGGPGTCGTMKYWDKKTKKCADATTKKV